ncbi:MAG: hypothetical protein DID90_2727552570 [Candidatus Nitrotoga sp. LAW]|nr:MAG: hypothetical protein DID90_2727552570 [Candidatus Nitrotoga sp. LAW]
MNGENMLPAPLKMATFSLPIEEGEVGQADGVYELRFMGAR